MADRTVRVIVSADVSNYTRGLGSAESRTQRFMGIANGVGRAAATGLGLAGAAAVGLGVAAAKTGVGYNNLQQTSRAALKTLLGGSVAANAQMDKLDAFARTSPFAKQVFITAQQQLLGFGMSAKQVIPTLDAVQNAVAAVGGSNDDIASISYSLAQVVGQGKITGETLNELGARGIDAAKLIGAQMGQTGDAIRSQITAGTLDAGTALSALVAGMQQQFGGAAANVKATWSGATDRIKAAWRDLSATLVNPFINQNGGGQAVDWANQVADLMRAVQKMAGPVVQQIVHELQPALNKIPELLNRAITAVDRFDPSKLKAPLDTLKQYGPVIAAISAGILAFGGSELPLIGGLLGSINPLVAILGTLAVTDSSVRSEIMGLVKALAPLAATLAGEVVPAVDAAVKIAAPLLQVITGVLRVVDALPGPLRGLVVGAAGIALLALRFSVVSVAITRTSAATVGLIAEMRVLYAQANANSIALSRMGAVTSVLRGRMQAAGASGKVGFGAIATGAVLAIAAFEKLSSSVNEAQGYTTKGGDEAANALSQIATAGDASKDSLKGLGVQASDLSTVVKNGFNESTWQQIKDWAPFGAPFASQTTDAKQFFQSVDAGLSSLMSNGQTDQAKRAFDIIASSAQKQGIGVDQLKTKLPGYTAALRTLDAQQKTTGDDTDDATAKLDRQGAALKAMSDAAGEASQSLAGANPLGDYSPDHYAEALKNVSAAQTALVQASKAVTRAQEDEADAMVQAERQIQQAQSDSTRAQLDLNDARIAAKRVLDDLDGHMVDVGLDEKSAALAVDRARAELNRINADPLSSTLDKGEALIAYQQAVRSLEKAQETSNDEQQKANDLQAKGVDGADDVVAAQQRVIDTQQALADAQKSAARSVADAREQSLQSLASYADAQQSLTEAKTAAWKASIEGAFASALANAEVFASGIGELLARGLNPAVVASLLKAGPEQAAPIIQQLLADHSGRLIGMMNSFTVQVGGFADQVGAFAQVATNAADDTVAHFARVQQQIQALATMSAAQILQMAPSIDIGVSGRGAAGHATGGPIVGPGTGTSDSIPLWGSNGEYMINALSTSKYRPIIEQINAGTFVMPKYATGGPIGQSSSAARLAKVFASTPPPPVAVTAQVGRMPVGQYVAAAPAAAPSAGGTDLSAVTAELRAMRRDLTALGRRPLAVTARVSARETNNAVGAVRKEERNR